MQFGKVVVGHEVAPLGATPWPARFIDQNCQLVLAIYGTSASAASQAQNGTLVAMALTTDRSDLEGDDKDVIYLTVPADEQFARLVRIAVASIARRRGLSVRAIDDLRLAVDEAFNLLLGGERLDGSVAVTFEVDDNALLVIVAQKIADGPVAASEEAQVGFEVVVADLVDHFEIDLETGVIEFSKLFGT